MNANFPQTSDKEVSSQSSATEPSSRLRITCLPKSATEAKLKAFLLPFGELTDLVILRKENGVPRMSFVGYRDSTHALCALKELNGSYLDNCRIKIENAHPVKTRETHSLSQKRRVGLTTDEAEKSEENSTKVNKRGTDRNVELQLDGISDEQFFRSIQQKAPMEDALPEKNLTNSDEIEQGMGKRIILKNLPFTTTKEGVFHFCSDKIGPVESVHIPLTLSTRQSRGIAFVTFQSENDAAEAVKELQNHSFEGRLLVAQSASPDPYAKERALPSAEFSKSQTAKKSEGIAGNTLFMDNEMVTQTVSKQLEVAKSDILDPSKTGIAFRTAVAEAVLTSDLSSALNEEGINMNVLKVGRTLAKSSKVILVKNVREITAFILNEVEHAFAKFGTIERLSAPKSYGIIIIGFLHECDALKAFRRLSFSNFHNLPLLLEWAPRDIYSPTSCTDIDNSVKPAAQQPTKGHVTQSSRTLFAKNIPHGCSEEKLRYYITNHSTSEIKSSDIRSIRVLSNKGYAFIECSSGQTASLCLQDLHNTLRIDDRTISIEEAKDAAENMGDNESDIAVPADRDPQKLTVKNVPFEATVSEIRSLFSAFSDVRSVRIPKKLHQYDSDRKNNHRGFAFVEFATSEGAAEAMKMLKHTHLYGRHLVLEYSKINA